MNWGVIEIIQSVIVNVRSVIENVQSVIENVQSVISVPECCCLGVPITTTREKCQALAIKRHKPLT